MTTGQMGTRQMTTGQIGTWTVGTHTCYVKSNIHVSYYLMINVLSSQLSHNWLPSSKYLKVY